MLKAKVWLMYLFLFAKVGQAGPCLNLLIDYDVQSALGNGFAADFKPTLDVHKTVEYVRSIARLHSDVKLSEIGSVDDYPLLRIDIPSSDPASRKILITAGVHGHEAVGPTATLALVEMIAKGAYRDKFSFVVFPMINPIGLAQGISQTKTGENLRFVGNNLQKEAALFVSSTQKDRFYASIDNHGAELKDGIFIIRQQDDLSGIAERSIVGVEENSRLQSPNGQYPFELPSSRAVIQSRLEPNAPKPKTAYMLIEPGIAYSFSHGSIKNLMKQRGTLGFTVEYPGQLPIPIRQTLMLKINLSLLNELQN